MSLTCDELEALLDTAEQQAADRKQAYQQAVADDARIRAELAALAESWGGTTDWEGYEYSLDALIGELTTEIVQLEARIETARTQTAALDDAWDEYGRLAEEFLDLEGRWTDVMEQLSGDQPGDASVPQSSLMDHADDLHDQMEAKRAEVEAALERLNQLLATDIEDPDALEAEKEAKETDKDALGVERENWKSASGDLKEELGSVLLEAREQEWQSAEAFAGGVHREWQSRCGDP
jgi:DNA repair exonuclease SbcCD ATPase subunit